MFAKTALYSWEGHHIHIQSYTHAMTKERLGHMAVGSVSEINLLVAVQGGGGGGVGRFATP